MVTDTLRKGGEVPRHRIALADDFPTPSLLPPTIDIHALGNTGKNADDFFCKVTLTVRSIL